MKIFLRILKYAKPYKHRILIAIICMLLVSICNASSMYLLKPLFDKGFLNADGKAAFEVIKRIALCLVGIYFVKGLAFYIQDYLLNNVGQKITMDIRNQSYNHIQYLSLSYFTSHKTGQILSRITTDVVNMQNAVGSICSILSNGFTFLGLACVVLKMNWELALLSFGVCAIIVLPIYRFGKKLRNISISAQNKIGDITSVAHEGITNTRIVKAFNMENYELEKFKGVNRSFFDTYMKAVRVTAMSHPIIEFIAIIAISILIIVSGYQISSGHLTIGSFASFTGALFLLFNPIKNLNGVNMAIQQAISSAERVFEILDTSFEVKDEPNAKNMLPFKEKISFVNVNFGYRKDKLVLKDINLEIKKGEIVAIVGPSGSGKSTLVDLIPRFYDLTSGRLEVDGIDIRNIKISSLREQFGLVAQETILFNDTIRNNIAYGRTDANFDEIIIAAKTANAHDFILKTQNGYDTFIGEKGVKLSGGERQRMAMARAVLKNPPVLILDEATSALDTESERLVQEALNNLMKNRTTIVIAHRLSTVINSHKIVVMDNGMIVAMGEHDELISGNSLYKKLYEMRFVPRTAKNYGVKP
ncbi:MAG: ABC transporter ATP-binding protein [Candidatus Firestonebacteria bacterium]